MSKTSILPKTQSTGMHHAELQEADCVAQENWVNSIVILARLEADKLH
jgi:hypothetical protein